MLVDPVKHYFYIWLIHVRRDGRHIFSWQILRNISRPMNCNYSVHHWGLSLSKMGNNISMINVI